MSKVLVCQHVAHEILGTFHPLLKDAGFRIRYINFSRHPDEKPTLEGYDGLILLGGPMNVDEENKFPFLSHELKMIETAMKMEIPLLGICLGSQLIAKTLGAKVSANTQSEIGWKNICLTEEGKKDPLLAPLNPQALLFEWHHDSFSLPSGATWLAKSENCINQAFKYGDKTYAFQFHMEVDEEMIEKWLQDPQHQKFLENSPHHPSQEKIREDTHAYIENLKKISFQSFSEFIKLFGIGKKFYTLPSR